MTSAFERLAQPFEVVPDKGLLCLAPERREPRHFLFAKSLGLEEPAFREVHQLRSPSSVFTRHRSGGTHLEPFDNWLIYNDLGWAC
jgi:hypothetical protein